MSWCVEFSIALGFPYLPRNVPVLAGYCVGVMGTGDASWLLSALMVAVPLRFSPLSLSHMRSCLCPKGQVSYVNYPHEGSGATNPTTVFHMR